MTQISAAGNMWTMFDAMLRDAKYAWRGMCRNPGFAAATILTLALGIGAASSIFSVVYAVLLRPLPYRDSSSLVLLFETSAHDSREPLLLADCELLQKQSRSFEDIAIFYKDTGFSRVTLSGVKEPESVQGAYVSANLFPVAGMSPSIGRAFTAREQSQSERVVLLSHRLWERRFGFDRDLSGKTLEIDGASFKVIGVMPADFQFPARDSAFWAPITTNRYWLERPAKDGVHVRGYYARWNAVARLKPAVPIERAQAEMKTLAPRLEETGLGLSAVPLQAEVSGNTRLALSILFAAVSFLLFISCANAAHLMLARGVDREREIAVRIALGAGRGDLLRRLLTEAVVLSLAGGCCGLLLARFGVQALAAYGPSDIPRLEQAALDTGVLTFTFVVSLLAAVLFALLPALKLASQRFSSRSSRLRASLVAVEFALTVVLLTGAGLLIRSFLAVEAIDPGFDPEHVLTVRVAPGIPQPSFYDQALERIAAVGGVRAAGAVSGGLFELGPSTGNGKAPEIVNGRLRVWADWKTVRGHYFEAMGMPLLRGRPFHSRDRAGAPLAAVIDQSMARRYWPGQDAIGKQFRGHDKRGRDDDPLTVVGVVRDTRSHGRERGATPHVFEPAAQGDDVGPTRELVIRTSGDPAKLASSVREIVRSLDRAAVISRIATMEQQLDEQTSPRRFQTWLLSLFSLIALLLASVGIYGVMHYAVATRTREIGIRMALGAERRSVLGMVMRQGLLMGIPGLVAGLAGSYGLTRLLRGLLFGVKAQDPVTYVVAALLLAVVATAAISVPAWRATRIDPGKALRRC